MFSTIRRLIGAIHVVEEGNLIHIEGLPVTATLKSIYKEWSTILIADYMFTETGRSSLSFNKFFAPDVAYALSTMILQRRQGKDNIRAFQKILELLYEHTWLKDTRKTHPGILNYARLKNLTVDLLDHQTEFLDTYNKNVPLYNLKGYLLGAAPGSGKTINTLALGEVLESDVVICIVPKNAVQKVWEDTLVSLFKTPTTYWISTSPDAPTPGCRHYVFHYERLDDAIAFFKQYQFKKPFVILDECHNLNELDSLRTKLFIQLCREILKCHHVVWASGTPVKAIGNEVIPLLMTIDDYFNEDAEQRFRQIYGKTASRAVDILRNRLGMMTFKVDKKIVVGNKVTQENIKVTISNGEKYTLDSVREEMSKFIRIQMAHYEKNMSGYISFYNECLYEHEKTLYGPQAHETFNQYKEYIRQIAQAYDPSTMKEMVVFCNNYELKQIIPSLQPSVRNEFKDTRSVVKYYNLKVQGEALGRILGKLRAQCHVDMIPFVDWGTIIDTAEKKTLIFTSYVEVVNALETHLEKEGYKPLKVYGDTNKDLPNIVNRYEKDIDANPLVATYKSLSTAVPLVMANVVVLLNSPFRDYERDQAVSRVDRLGQTSPVVVINILLETDGKPNISTRSNDILNWSKEQVNAIMGINVDNFDVSMEVFSDMITDVQIPSVIPPVELPKPAYTKWV